MDNNNAKTQTSSQSNDWRVELLQSVINDTDALGNLFELLYNAWELHDSPSVLSLNCAAFQLWIESGVDLNENRYEVRDFVNNLAQQIRIKEAFNLFNNNSGYERAFDKKGVSRE